MNNSPERRPLRI